MSLTDEIARRRTFAIISHPDAGKTTLTEKFLLYGGAIQTAGAVKSNKIRKGATSDFMEIERQRGISVSTSVMTFDYAGKLINLLDTPGHKDFAEDTYRTLTAVDSVVLVVDCVKGVEAQTERLMEVCRMRDTPVIVFINKMDLEGRDTFDLLDELEAKLSIKVRPLSWPIGIGATFKGVYDMYDGDLKLFESIKTKVEAQSVSITDLKDPRLDQEVGEDAANLLREEVELVNGVYGEFGPACRLKIDAPIAPKASRSLSFPLSVRKEQLKVLVIESFPRWEYRYLRNALERDPGVEVNCLLLHPGLGKVGAGRGYLDKFPKDVTAAAGGSI